MRISKIRVRNFRCLNDVEVEVPDYCALVGPNGSGKSSVLYALDWFFNDRSMESADLHTTEANPEGTSQEIDVEVEFSDLTDEDRKVLGPYGRADTARLRRIWSAADGKDKMIGNSRQGPGFAAVRAKGGAQDMKDAYATLRTENADLGLPAATTKRDIHQALDAWEAELANSDKLVEVDASDASHLFGFNGENVLAARMRLVLIPATTDIAGETAVAGKSSAVAQLIGALTAEAIATARAAWEADNAEQLAQLTAQIKQSIEDSTGAQAERVNTLLSSLVPNATVDFVSANTEWTVRGTPDVQTDVVIDGERKNVARQGHGVQRAVIMSMLQALVPDEVTAQAKADAEDGPDLDESLAALPALVVCVEEPEIYQHPIRARHFARVLSQWSANARSQVILATHSPYFVLPEQFGSLRRFSLQGGKTVVRSTSATSVATNAQVETAKVERVVEKETPRTFSEGFFADAVVFVEGDTDRVVIETLAERLKKPLDSEGVAVLAMGGKGNLRIPFEILNQLGIPAYIVADGDALGATRKHPTNTAKQAEVAENHKKQTEDLVAWLPAVQAPDVTQGSVPYNWGDSTVISTRWTIWHDDLEAELEGWEAYEKELKANGEDARSKRVATYRAAMSDADLHSLPEALQYLVDAVRGFKDI